MAITADKVVVSLQADIDQYHRKIAEGERKFEQHMNGIRRQAGLTEVSVERNMRGMGSSVQGMSSVVRSAIAAIALTLAGRQVMEYADAWTEAGNKIAAAGTPLEKQSQRLKELANLAVETRSSFEATSTLYARLGIATEDLAGKSFDLLKITETVNKAFIAGGASAEERRSGIIQLSQALASGVLQGEELRALRESAPLLLKAIAKEFDTTIGGLKKLGAEGELTTERLLTAIENGAGDIEGRFAQTNATIGDSFTNLQTRVIEYIGASDDSLKASENIAEAINFVASNVESFADALVVAGAALTGAFGGSVAVSVATGLNTMAAGATGAAGAMNILKASAAFMFGPAGIVIGISAAAAALAYFAIQAGKSESATQKLKTRLDSVEVNLKEIASNAGIAWEDIAEGARATLGPVDEATRKLEELRKNLEETGALARQNALNSAAAEIIEAQSARAQALANIEAIQDKREYRRAGNMEKKAKELEAATASLEKAEKSLAQAEALRRQLFDNTTNEDFKPSSSAGTGSGAGIGEKERKASEDVLRAIEEAYRATFETERALIQRNLKEKLEGIDKIRGHEAEKEVARQQAIETAIADEQALRDEEAKLAKEQADKDKSILDQVLDARDQVAGRTEAILERQYAADREFIEQRIENAEIEKEALLALEEKYQTDLAAVRQDFRDRDREAELSNMQTIISATEGFLSSLTALAEQRFGKNTALAKAFFLAQQAAGAAQVVVSAEIAKIRALAELGPIAGPPAAAGIEVAKNISLATIAAQTVVGFKDGVIDLQGPGTSRSDSIHARLSKGESVINSKGTKLNPNVLQRINKGENIEAQLSRVSQSTAINPAFITGGGRLINIGGTTLQVQGNITEDAIPALRAEINRMNRDIEDRVSRVIDGDRTRTTPRHERNRFFMG